VRVLIAGVLSAISMVLLADCASVAPQDDSEARASSPVIVRPLSGFDFDEGVWCAYLLIHRTDADRWKDRINGGPCLGSCETSVLAEMARRWEFEVSGGDTTMASSFIVVKDGIRVFETLITLDEGHEGLQNGTYGYAVATTDGALSETLRLFAPLKGPQCIPLIPD
jgi:hypothetical protein